MNGVMVMLFRPEARVDLDAEHNEAPFDGVELFKVVATEDDALQAIDQQETKFRAEHNGAEPNWKWMIEDISPSEPVADPKANLDPEQPPEFVETEPIQLCGYSAVHKLNGVRATTTIDCGRAVGVVAACQECADFYENMYAPKTDENKTEAKNNE